MNKKNYLLIALGAIAFLTSSIGAMDVQELSKQGSLRLYSQGRNAAKEGNFDTASTYLQALELKAENATSAGLAKQFNKQADRLRALIGDRGVGRGALGRDGAGRPPVPPKTDEIREAGRRSLEAYNRRMGRPAMPVVPTPTPEHIQEMSGEADEELAGTGPDADSEAPDEPLLPPASPRQAAAAQAQAEAAQAEARAQAEAHAQAVREQWKKELTDSGARGDLKPPSQRPPAPEKAAPSTLERSKAFKQWMKNRREGVVGNDEDESGWGDDENNN